MRAIFTRVRGAVPRRACLALTMAAVMSAPALAQAPPVSPNDFVAAAGASDQYEIMAARLALTESRDPALRAFAQNMIREHSAAFESLSRAATESGLKPPSTSLNPEQSQLLGALQSVRGADFDRAYARQQKLAHQSALTTTRGYAERGSDPNLRRAAAADVPMIQRHAQAADALASARDG